LYQILLITKIGEPEVMKGPKSESDNRGGIKCCEEVGARLTFDAITRITKIPHGKNSPTGLAFAYHFQKDSPKLLV
jgi:hypothetical protein